MYNLDEIKKIPIKDLCSDFGISLIKKGNRLWGKIRDEDTSSFSIREDKNLWYDYGLGIGGTGIEFVAKIKNIDKNKAINIIGDLYEVGKKDIEKFILTDSQYKKIGIESQKVTLNFTEDVYRQPVEKIKYWYEKFNISIKELSEQYPEMYQKLIEKKSIGLINNLKIDYISCIDKYKNSNGLDKEVYMTLLKEYEKDINEKAHLIERALGKKLDYLKVNLNKDLQGKGVEIGKVSYWDLKKQGMIKYLFITKEEFNKLNHSNIPYSAYIKDKKIGIAMKTEYLKEAFKLMEKEIKRSDIGMMRA